MTYNNCTEQVFVCRKAGYIMTGTKMQAVQHKNQAEPPAQREAVQEITDYINQFEHPKAILNVLLSFKPLFQK